MRSSSTRKRGSNSSSENSEDDFEILGWENSPFNEDDGLEKCDEPVMMPTTPTSPLKSRKKEPDPVSTLLPSAPAESGALIFLQQLMFLFR